MLSICLRAELERKLPNFIPPKLQQTYQLGLYRLTQTQHTMTRVVSRDTDRTFSKGDLGCKPSLGRVTMRFVLILI